MEDNINYPPFLTKTPSGKLSGIFPSISVMRRVSFNSSTGAKLLCK